MELWLIAGVVLLLLIGGLIWLLDQLGFPNPFAISGVAVVCLPVVVAVYWFNLHLIGYLVVAVVSYLAGLLTYHIFIGPLAQAAKDTPRRSRGSGWPKP